MKYCSHCAAPLAHRVPGGDNLPRFVCDQCGQIHYENPKLVVGVVPVWRGEILLCRRSIEPRAGYWTVPAGFLENDETLAEGAQREAREEALARVRIGSMLAIVDVVHARQVHFFFRGELIDGKHGVGEESSATGLYEERDIPWAEIAFPSIEFALRSYLGDRTAGREELHMTRAPRLRLGRS